jgi:hypothetical protein
MRFRDWPQFWIFVEKLVWDSTRKGGLMMIRQSVNFTHASSYLGQEDKQALQSMNEL